MLCLNIMPDSTTKYKAGKGKAGKGKAGRRLGETYISEHGEMMPTASKPGKSETSAFLEEIARNLSNPRISRDESAVPFDAALWKHIFNHDQQVSTEPGRTLLSYTYKKSQMPPRESDVAPVRNITREIKMMSLNPSVYGNCYGVLGSS
jgi:hypothetical protein